MQQLAINRPRSTSAIRANSLHAGGRVDSTGNLWTFLTCAGIIHDPDSTLLSSVCVDRD